MTLALAALVVGTLWAAVALAGIVVWSRARAAEIAVALTSLRLEYEGGLDDEDIPEEER
jgi:hypothetical protein